MKKTIYLANPYGFSEQQKRELLPLFVEALESLGLEVWEPFERNNQESILAPGWAYRIGQADIRDVADADAIFAILNGIPPDEGVMVELGAAIALGKPTFLFRDDHRKVTECEEYPLNLMIFTGLPQDGWEDWYYTSFDEITSPDKALARWSIARLERYHTAESPSRRGSDAADKVPDLLCTCIAPSLPAPSKGAMALTS